MQDLLNRLSSAAILMSVGSMIAIPSYFIGGMLGQQAASCIDSNNRAAFYTVALGGSAGLFSISENPFLGLSAFYGMTSGFQGVIWKTLPLAILASHFAIRGFFRPFPGIRDVGTFRQVLVHGLLAGAVDGVSYASKGVFRMLGRLLPEPAMSQMSQLLSLQRA